MMATELNRREIAASGIGSDPKSIRAFEDLQRYAFRDNPAGIENAKGIGEAAGLAAEVADGKAVVAQDTADSALAEATTKQPADDALTALSSLPDEAGVVERTGIDTFSVRAIGADTPKSLLTREVADERYSMVDDVDAAWTEFMPTLSAASGSFAAAAATGRYKRLGSTVFIHIRVNITDAGTAAGAVLVEGLPHAAAGLSDFGRGDCAILAMNDTQSGACGYAAIIAGTTAINILRYDGASAIASNRTLQVGGCYEAT